MLKQLSHSASHKTSEHFINLKGDGLFDPDIILLHINIYSKISCTFQEDPAKCFRQSALLTKVIYYARIAESNEYSLISFKTGCLFLAIY